MMDVSLLNSSNPARQAADASFSVVCIFSLLGLATSLIVLSADRSMALSALQRF